VFLTWKEPRFLGRAINRDGSQETTESSKRKEYHNWSPAILKYRIESRGTGGETTYNGNGQDSVVQRGED